jgi:hypothetical protein
MYREFQNLVLHGHAFVVSHLVTAEYGDNRFLFGYVVAGNTFPELPRIRVLILPRGYVLNAARYPEEVAYSQNYLLLEVPTLWSRMIIIYTTRFNILKFCILPTQCICVSRMVLTINGDCFPKQH